MSQIILSQTEVLAQIQKFVNVERIIERDRVWGIPRGGVPVTLAVAALSGATVVQGPSEATIIIDDIYDSGRTMARYQAQYPGKRYLTLFDKRLSVWKGRWLVLPWEANESHDNSATDAVVRLLELVGEDSNREGLLQTPSRVVKAWRELCSGYGVNPADVLTTFKEGAERVNELVVMRNIPIYSMCEHHLLPFFGTATIGYIPNGKIVGLSKLVRLADVFARRLQVQEVLTNQIADSLMEHLEPLGVGVIIECRHMCMEARGVHAPNTPTTTSALRGALYDDQRARSEFLQLRLK